MSSIYHYCSINTLLSILKNKTLRLSDITKSNDFEEINLVFEKFIKWAKSNPNFNEGLGEIAYATKKQLQNTTFLVMCFSKNSDSIHMWNSYAKNGVAIEFDQALLNKYIDKVYFKDLDSLNNLNFKTKALLLKDVEYVDDVSLNEKFDNYKADDNNSYFDFLFNDASYLKSNFFSSEEEVRIACVYNLNHIPSSNALVIKDEVIKECPLEVILSNNSTLKLVVDIPIDLNIIKSITLSSDAHVKEKDIKELLLATCNNSLKFKIKTSKGTLRYV